TLLQQARPLVRITQAGLFPQLTGRVSAQRSSASANQPTASGIPLSGTSAPEADAFGGVRRNVESSNGPYQASAANLENVRLVVTSELAVDYFSLRELDSEIAVVNSAVE